jgi:DNA-binding MarR family transcriptional regulator
MLREGEAPVRTDVLAHCRELGPSGLSVYTVLCLSADAGGFTEASTREIADLLGTGTHRVTEALTALESMGYIRYARGTGTGSSCVRIIRQADGQERKEQPVSEDSKSAGAVFDAWNAAGIVKHRKLTPPMQKQITRTLKMYSEEEIIESITNYAAVLAHPKTRFTYVWTLQEFLGRHEGMNIERFSDSASPLKNFTAGGMFTKEGRKYE